MNVEIKNNVREYDVIVVGGGPSGCAAAIAAAREGARTLIVENGSALGGMATLGMVSKWAPFTDREKVIYESIPREIMMMLPIRRIRSMTVVKPSTACPVQYFTSV